MCANVPHLKLSPHALHGFLKPYASNYAIRPPSPKHHSSIGQTIPDLPLVVLLVEADCTIPLEGERVVQSCPGNVQPNRQDNMQTTLAETEWPRPPLKRRRTHRGRARELETPLGPCAKSRPRVSGASTPGTLSRRAEGSALSASPGSGRECGGGGGGSSSTGSERGCMDESWFVTPPPCFTAEGATAEASPMEDLLIEHPSMSVYVSPNNLSMVSNGNLSVVGEESVSLAGSMR